MLVRWAGNRVGGAPFFFGQAIMFTQCWIAYIRAD
jgi:hypothetical protein